MEAKFKDLKHYYTSLLKTSVLLKFRRITENSILNLNRAPDDFGFFNLSSALK